MLVRYGCGVVCFTVGVYLYWFESSKCDFAFDDHLAVRENRDVVSNDENAWRQLFLDDFWGRELWVENSHKSYRPLTVASFRAEHKYWLGNEMVASSFHRTNVLLHGVVSALVCFIGENLVQGFIAGLIFAVHPVHVEAVVGVVGRAELLCALFYIVAYLYLEPGESVLVGLLLCMTAFVLSILSKEIGITFAALGFSFHVGKAIVHGKATYSWRIAFLYFTGLTATCIGYLYTRYLLCENTLDLGSSGLIRKTENPYLFLEPGVMKFLSLHIVILKYIELLVIPTEFSAEYSFNCIKMVESFDDKRLIWVAISYSILLVLTIAALYRVFVVKRMELALYLGWLVVPFIPSSHIFVTVGTLVAERVLYIPSIGYCLVLGWLASKLMDRIPKVFVYALVVVLMSRFWQQTLVRIPDWKNDETLFQAAVKVCPDSAKMNSQVAQVMLNRGNLEQMEYYLERAKKIDPTWCDLDLHYANLAILKDDVKEATEKLISSLDCIYTTNRALEILQSLWRLRIQQAQALGVEDPSLYEERGRVYLKAEKEKEAIAEFKAGAWIATKTGPLIVSQSIFDRVLQLKDSSEEMMRASCEIAYVHGMTLEKFNKTMEAVAAHRYALNCKETMPGSMGRLYVLYNALIEKDPQNSDWYEQLADSLILAKKHQLSGDKTLIEQYTNTAIMAWQQCAHFSGSDEKRRQRCVEKLNEHK